jgi:glycosyltransferase involved in cell wall biosynthesis
VRWEHERYEKELIEPIRAELRREGCSFDEIRYGYYEEADFRRRLGECRAMVFLCEHETQGIAYQQALSCCVPVLAWDRGGYWQDPTYYPDRAKFSPVTSVPYWDERCGVKFHGIEEFGARLEEFKTGLDAGRFAPRDYVLEHLELGAKAREFADIVQRLACDLT